MIVASQEAFEERIDAAGAAAAAHNANSIDPLSGTYISEEYEHYHATMESHIDELSNLLSHIQVKGGINKLTAERIEAVSPGFIKPSRPLASFTTDFTRTNFVASQEGLMDTLKAFKDNILKALAALIKKFTDWVSNVFKSWRKENDEVKDNRTEAVKLMNQYDRVYDELILSFQAVCRELHQDETGTAVCQETTNIIRACKLDVNMFEHMGHSEAKEFFAEYQFRVMEKKLGPVMNAFLQKLINGDPTVRSVIQNLVLDVQKRLPEITNRMEKINRTLVFNDAFTTDVLIHPQELINVGRALGVDAEVVDILTGDVEAALDTMFNFPMSTWYTKEHQQKLLNADLMLDVLSGVDIAYLRQIKELRQKGEHLSGILSSLKGEQPQGLREMLVDLSNNLASVNRVLNMIRVITLQVRRIVLVFTTAVDEIRLMARRIAKAIVGVPTTAAVKDAVLHANNAVELLP